MTLLHFKNGVSFEDPTTGVAAAVKAIHENDQPRAISMDQVPGIENWLKSQERSIRAQENLVIELGVELGQYETKLEAVLKSLKVLDKMAPSSSCDAQIQKGKKLQRAYQYETEELSRRIDKAKTLAAQTRRIVAEFHKDNPSWPRALADYKVLDQVPSFF